MSAVGTSRRFAAPHQFDSSWAQSGHVSDMAGTTRLTPLPTSEASVGIKKYAASLAKLLGAMQACDH
jgi:hypothetical protein